jgi:hypothetical protein
LAARSSASLGVIFRTVWGDVAEVFARLRTPSTIGLLIYLAFEILGLAAPVTANNPVLRDLLDAIKSILVLPFEIAIYRLLLLGEATSHYNFAISTSRFQRMLGWTLGLWALVNIPPYLLDAFTSSDGAKTLVTIAAAAIIIVIMLRLAILLPAIAVDASGASARNALADTRGRVWFVFKVSFLPLLPLLLIAVLAVVLASPGAAGAISDSPSWWSVPKVAFDASLGFMFAVLTTVIASRLFDWIGDRLKGDAQDQAG